MGLRTGIDLTSIERIESVLEQFGERFHRKYFGNLESAYGDVSPRTYAGLWAVKEAAFKVAGGRCPATAVTVRYRSSGRPELHVDYDEASLEDSPIPRAADWDCSIAHDDGLAVAVAACTW